MRVGWLADSPGYIGGAELTQAEFRAAAPEGVEVVDCPPGAVAEGLDRYVVHNHMSYGKADLERARPRAVRYLHDMRPQRLAGVPVIFCSPLQRERFRPRLEGPAIPPAIDLGRFSGPAVRNGHKREGAIWLGHFMNPGKGAALARYWAERNEPLDVYASGPCLPSPSHWLRQCGSIPYEEVPTRLACYRTFVFLPTAIEPFGRAVVEAWAAGCRLVLNDRVGAAWWIEENPEGLKSAAADFWQVVLR